MLTSEPLESVANDDVLNTLAQVMLDKDVACYQHMQLIPSPNTQDEALIKIVNCVDQALQKRSLENRQNLAKLSNDTHFTELNETDLILLHRFVKRRDALLKSQPFVDASSFAKLLGLNDQNVARKMKQLRDKQQVLAVEMTGSVMYPQFQLDKEGAIYPALVAELPRILDAGRSNWEICFWLHDEQTLTISSPAIDTKALVDISLEEILALGKAREAATIYHTGTPMNTLVTNNTATFVHFVDDWIAPDERTVIKDTVL
jgi:hypothetical protein